MTTDTPFHLESLKVTPTWSQYPNIQDWLLEVKTGNPNQSVIDLYTFTREENAFRCKNNIENKIHGRFDEWDEGFKTLLGYYLQSTDFEFNPDSLQAMARVVARLHRSQYALFTFHYLSLTATVDVDADVHIMEDF